MPSVLRMIDDAVDLKYFVDVLKRKAPEPGKPFYYQMLRLKLKGYIEHIDHPQYGWELTTKGYNLLKGGKSTYRSRDGAGGYSR